MPKSSQLLYLFKVVQVLFTTFRCVSPEPLTWSHRIRQWYRTFQVDLVFQHHMKSWIGHSQQHLRMVPQTRITSKKMLEQMKNEAASHGWEGLVLRRDTAYQGKRR